MRWGADLRDGEQSREMGSRPERWGTDMRYGELTREMGSRPEAGEGTE